MKKPAKAGGLHELTFLGNRAHASPFTPSSDGDEDGGDGCGTT